jgi:hypothetical protein
MGHYYKVLASGIRDDPNLFAPDEVSARFKARVLLSIAQAVKYRGDYSTALRQLIEVSRLAFEHSDYLTAYLCRKELAIIQSIDGDHQGALTTLDQAFPLVRLISPSLPVVYYEHLNSLSVEYPYVGNADLARRLIQISIKSPYADRYGEWEETRLEIGDPGPSRVFLFDQKSKPSKVIRMPRRAKTSISPGPHPAAALLEFTLKKPAIPTMTNKEKLQVRVVYIGMDDNTPEHKLERMVEAFEAEDSDTPNRLRRLDE